MLLCSCVSPFCACLVVSGVLSHWSSECYRSASNTQANTCSFMLFLQYKTDEVRSKCTGLMRVNLYKDQISPVGSMPPLPNDKALYASLRPAYNVLKAAGQQRAQGRPMYAITDDQKKAADSFLKVCASPWMCSWVPLVWRPADSVLMLCITKLLSGLMALVLHDIVLASALCMFYNSSKASFHPASRFLRHTGDKCLVRLGWH